MKAKKTLYQVLDIPANASGPEIQTAYLRQMQTLQSEESRLSHEDFSFRLTLLNLALETLSDPVSRRAYDETLMSRMAPSRSPHALALHEDADILSRRADALAFRADALALRADAMSIRADAAPFRADDGTQSLLSRIFSLLKSPLKKVFVALGTLAAIMMLAQTALLFFSAKQVEKAASTQARAEEQVQIQEYYQTHGVRPANATEARLLEMENRRRETETRVAEREKQRVEEEARRFQEESRRLGERVSADLRHAEEMARREEAQKKAEREEEVRRKEEAENERLEREREKWRTVLSR